MRYPGYAMVNQSKGGLVFVQIQYRLSSHGFLSSAELRGNGIANAGLLDQRAALNWVQRVFNPSKPITSANATQGHSY